MNLVIVNMKYQEKERRKPGKGISGGRLMDIDTGRGCTRPVSGE
jgi:hypothetical protein